MRHPKQTTDNPQLLQAILDAQDRLLAADVDWTLLERNPRLTPTERLQQHDANLNAILAMREQRIQGSPGADFPADGRLSPEQLAALERTRERMRRGRDLGGRMPRRDEIYER